MRPYFIPFVLLILLGACSTEVGRDNPFDPDAPLADKAKATVTGVVTLDWQGDVTRVEVNIDGKLEHPGADGSYEVADITPREQLITFRLENYADWTAYLDLRPGEEQPLDVSLNVMRGGVSGDVELEHENDHSGVTLVLTRSTTKKQEDPFQLAAISAPSGSYLFTGVPVGEYDLSATKPHYNPDGEPDLVVTSSTTTVVRTLVLPPVTGAVDIEGGPDFVNPDYDNEHYTRTRDVRVHVEGFNAVEMKVSELPDLADADWEIYATHSDFTLSELDGAKTVYVLLKNENDIQSERLEGHTVLDTQPPKLFDVLLGDGGGYTSEVALTVKSLADDLPEESGIAQMRIKKGEEPFGAGDLWEVYNLDASVTLDDQDGEQSVQIQIRDRAGNPSEAVLRRIRLDRQAPVPGPVANGPPVRVGNGSGYVTSLDVPVILNIVDNVTPTEDLLMLVCTAEGCPGESPGPYTTHTMLSFASPGSYTVYTSFIDGAGNSHSPEPVPFVIDTEPPTFPVVTVEEGVAVANPDIHLWIDASGADEMHVSEDPARPAPDDPDWVAFANRVALTLETGEGPHNVFVYLRDQAGHVAGPGSAVVTLDTTPPTGTIEFHLADPFDPAVLCSEPTCYTNSESVYVDVTVTSADDPASLKMVLSLDPDFNEAPQIFTPQTAVLLANVAGEQKVWVQFIDAAGNVSSDSTDQGVILDLVTPTLPVIVTNPIAYSNLTAVKLRLVSESQDDIGFDPDFKYQYQIDPPPTAWGNAPWREADFDGLNELIGIVQLDPCTGSSGCDYRTYVYKLRARDLAGNVGDAATIAVTLDQTPPPHPWASVSQMDENDPAGSRVPEKILNADVGTIYVTISSSTDDPNFIQFLTAQSDTGPWYQTGVGVGGIQIPVTLTPDAETQFWVCGRDAAGNQSCSDPNGVPNTAMVTFKEDSVPPRPPIAFPASARVNADSVVMSFKTHSVDPLPGGYGISGYECAINGAYECQVFDPSDGSWNVVNELPANVDRFRVDLEPDSDNIIHLRGIDMARNRSGTAQAVVTEDSHTVSMTTFLANPAYRTGAELTMETVHHSAIENMWVAAAFYGAFANGDPVDGVLLIDLVYNQVAWYEGSFSSHLFLEGQRLVMDASVASVCDGVFGPLREGPIADPSGEAMCQCYEGDMLACGMLHPQIVDMLRFSYNAHTLIMVDLTTGAPVARWIRTPAHAVTGIEHVILSSDDFERMVYSFDGTTLAWAESPDMWGDGNCRLNSVKIPDGCIPSDFNCPFEARGEHSVGVDRCGRVAVAENVVVWAELEGSRADMMISSNDLTGTAVLSAGGCNFGPSLEDDVVTDCTWDPIGNKPICQHLFWVDRGLATPRLKVLDLNSLPALVIDELREGLVEMRGVAAEQGRVVWQDTLEGTDDIFYLDLYDPLMCPGVPGDRQCLGNHGIVTAGPLRENRPSVWGDLVAYWRSTSEGRELRVRDMGSHPWLFARWGSFFPSAISDGKVLATYMNAQTPAEPYRFDVYDPANGSLVTRGVGQTFALPVGFRSVAGQDYIAYYGLTGLGTLMLGYCDCQLGPCQDVAVEVFPHAAGNYTMHQATGDEHRLVWTEWNNSNSDIVIIDCDMDPAGSKPCASLQSRELLVLEQAAGPRFCGMSVGGNSGILFLTDDFTNQSAAFRLDLATLDGFAGAGLISEIINQPLTYPGVVEMLGTWNEVGYCGGFEPISAVDPDSGALGLVVVTKACGGCDSDNPATFINEACGSEPCCGDVPCVCDDGSCHSHPYVRIYAYPAPGQSRLVAGWLAYEKPAYLSIRNNWMVWTDKSEGNNDLFISHLDRGGRQRLTYDIGEQDWPRLGYMPGDGVVPGGLHLIWADSRIGSSQIFHKLIE